MEQEEQRKYRLELRGETADLVAQVAEATGVPVAVVLKVALGFYAWALEEEREGRDIGAHDAAKNSMHCVRVAQLARDAHSEDNAEIN